VLGSRSGRSKFRQPLRAQECRQIFATRLRRNSIVRLVFAQSVRLRERDLHQNSWSRWLVPPIRDVIFVVLFFSLCFGSLAQRLLRDGGTGWHIRAGQRILATHAIPRTDPFSLSTAGEAWYAWEWLYEAGLGIVYNHAGLNGAVAATALLVAFTFAWLFSLMRERGADVFTATVLLLLAFAAAAIHLQVRPHVVSWLLTLVWWFVLERAREKDNPWFLIWLPPLTALWVNIHGGFLFGFALLGVYDFDAIWRLKQKRDDPEARRWLVTVWLTTALCGVATLLNPYHVNLHRHIYKYLTDTFLMHHIQEFQAPNFHDFSPLCFAALGFLGIAGFALARNKPGLREVAAFAFAIWAGLYASRNLPVSSMLMAVITGPFISAALRQRVYAARAPNSWVADRLGMLDATFRGGLWPGAAVLVVLWLITHSGYFGRTQLMHAQFDGAKFPVAAVKYLQTSGIQAPLFTPDQWGGYLIYEHYPAVLVDDRHDLYGDEFFKRYLTIVHVEPGWQEAIEQMHPRYMLIPTGSQLAAHLQSAEKWRQRYQDSVGTLFERTTD
jgi:hypothetical protein